jgi:hypothetical protein
VVDPERIIAMRAREGMGDDRFGWVHSVATGKQAQICVLDSYFRRISFWNDKGPSRAR